MSVQLNSLAKIALSVAIYDSYYERNSISTPEIDVLMKELKTTVEHTLSLYPKLNTRELDRIGNKIEIAKKKTMLSKPRSILTFIEFSIAVLDEPARKCSGDRKKYVNCIIELLLKIRLAIGGGREYMLSQISAAHAADVWDTIQI